VTQGATSLGETTGRKRTFLTMLPHWQSSPDNTAGQANRGSRSNIDRADKKRVHRTTSASSVAAVYGDTTNAYPGSADGHGPTESPRVLPSRALGPRAQLDHPSATWDTSRLAGGTGVPFREHTFANRSTNLERLAPLATQAARSVDLAGNPPQPFSRRPSRSRKLSLLRRRKILPEIRKGPFWTDTEPVIIPMERS